LTSLSESLASGEQLLKKLKRYNDVKGAWEDEVLDSTKARVEKLERSGNVREEQCEVLSGITGNLDGLSSSDLSLMGGGGLGLGVLDAGNEEEGSREADNMEELVLHLRDIVEDTSSLHDSLLILLETLAHASSASTSAMRQLRNIRAQILAWRDREKLEEAALRRKEVWEAEKLERGLKGVWLGDVLKPEVEGFRVFLKEVESRMQRLRAGGV
jgi:hypothetical protein